ncbi:MAG: hypothetical protein JO087_12435, partial [Actinobacteria bacterium]|nr:hypothetical protein [Actinomycetota bacterium]
MRIAMALLACSLALGTGCKKKKAETGGDMGSGSAAMVASGAGSADMGSAMAGSGSAGGMMAGSDTGSGAAMAGSDMGSGDQAMAHHAGMCPSTVFGSTTKAEVKGKDIVVTITSTDKDAVTAIQKRTDELLKVRSEKKEPGTAHDQQGTHGQTSGLCPVHIPEGATAKAKHEKDGV